MLEDPEDIKGKEMLNMMIDLSNWIGTYSPVVDPITGSIVAGMAGLDWTYIGRLIMLLVVVTSFLTLLISIVKGIAKR